MIYQIIIILAIATLVVILGRRLRKLNKGEQVKPIFSPIFEKASQTRPDSKISEADRLFEGKKFRRAEALYVKEAAANPDNPKIYNRLGAIYLELGEYRDAREAFEQAVKLDPTVAFRHANLGVSHLKLGNRNKAIECFEEAKRLEPDNEKYQDLIKEAKEKS